ncbi:3-carboxyethylcatechol 2,3-dioxygenase [Actinomadura livida]|uniref:2,3-dihydroxyphenylpropionate/2,3-dihydroxicinnamic acid 1,2-dioxygenase n=1 Tax=Actinomadura livida TaxID=79909 RepID=A0A7W7IF94_9ACTN|nr:MULTISPECIES: 3-carboxyethylcatechol 2,3-dioxygenase [Actinomadura]MBB4775921.1 2,3-dihydroxyphenylpropionate 1,2-dioxygenase [Actinomadura catellatispora]GGU16756.1 2,3-dihydroxyphenylpropionate/2,3-dihydroxicinnamic acid 1,2-dioxygenase [Actinomadura livida]
MPLALCATSHSPLLGRNDPPAEVRREVEAALARAGGFARDFDPELVVVFGPDHYNGFLYEVMPPFCVGAAATSVGDYGLPAGPLPVDRDAAHRLAREALASGVDVAVSEDMRVDHGFVQTLLFLFGSVEELPPVVPVFVNCVAEPLGPAVRARLLGEAAGRAFGGPERRVLVVGSGGLSHDPPVPRLAEAPPEVAERLTRRREVGPGERAEREARTAAAAAAFAAGSTDYRELNPEFDALVLDALASGDLAAIDSRPNEWFVREGGHSAHEVRTWIAAYAALSTQGAYEVVESYYRPVKEWFAGFAVTTAVSRGHKDGARR